MYNNILSLRGPRKMRGCVIGGPRQIERLHPKTLSNLLYRFEEALRISVFQYYNVFHTCMTMGFPLMAAEQVLQCREEYPHIRLHCVLPCETQAAHWPEAWRERYYNVLAEADDIQLLQAKYTPGCHQAATRHMLNRADRLILVGDETKEQLPYVFRYAASRNVDVVLLGKSRKPQQMTFMQEEPMPAQIIRA